MLGKITLADGSLSVPEGILEDAFIRIYTFFYPIDIVVVETSDFISCPLILGRDFLATTGATFDMDKGEVSIKYNDKVITYKVTERLGGQFSDAEDECRLDQFTRRSQKGASGAMPREAIKQELHLFEEGVEVMLREPITYEDNLNRAAECFGPFTIKIKHKGGMASIKDDASKRIMVHQSWLKIFEDSIEQHVNDQGK